MRGRRTSQRSDEFGRPRPRVRASCNNQPLPSGSLNEAKEEQLRRAGSGPLKGGLPDACPVEHVAHVDPVSRQFGARLN